MSIHIILSAPGEWEDDEDYAGRVCPACGSLISYEAAQRHYDWHINEPKRLTEILNAIIEGE